MALIKISKDLIEELMQICKNTHPNEFFAYLGEEDGVVNHYYIVPYFYSTKNSVSFRDDLLPIGLKIAGTIHSHPSFNPTPSNEDLHVFEKRSRVNVDIDVNIIITFPYTIDSIYYYDRAGKRIDAWLV